MTLTNLPYTVFLEILCRLPAADIVVCRRLSSGFYQTLTRNDLSISLILLHFPRSREGRVLRRYVEQDDRNALVQGDWSAVFAVLARRYFHLGNAMPWKTEKIAVVKDSTRVRGVTPWHRFLMLDQRTTYFHYWDPVWTFSPADGLLVFPKTEKEGKFVYRARDLTTQTEITVPFDTVGKVVRRVRLSHGVLIFEWCEKAGYTSPSGFESAHRHFVTAYDVVRKSGSWCDIIATTDENARHVGATTAISPTGSPWSITYRSEWKIHHLDLPFNHQDRFFSTHNRTHYVVYIWQPTQSPWNEFDPHERLLIWDIGRPSTYRPSLDPTGQYAPGSASCGPRIIRCMIDGDLSNWGVQQRGTPCLRALAIDDTTWDESTQSVYGHVFFLEEEHRWCAGPHSSSDPPRQHHVLSTGIPLLGQGPHWFDDCGGDGRSRSSSSNNNHNEHGTDHPGLKFCRRGPRQRLSQRRGSNDMPWNPGANNTQDDTWPGRAPCWRHDDFPYLTVSEVFDTSAGVRISARHCFMMETLSVHIRPQLRIEGVEASHRRTVKGKTKRKQGKSKGKASSDTGSAPLGLSKPKTRSEGPQGEEIHFDDDWWGKLMGRGCIYGDERWIVGEDKGGNITILMF